MKQSLWILTSSLLALFLCTMIFAMFTGINKPKFYPIKATLVKESTTKKLNFQEISAIYENDLFSTYIPKPIIKNIETEKIQSPRIPEIVNPPKIQKQEPNFLEPIQFTLVGTIVSPIDTESRAVVADNRTKKEQSYAIGNEIEDSQIIDINYKSITLIRSNGQKETLYLSGFDKILKKINAVDNAIAKNINQYEYIIDPDAFINKIRTLGELIDELNLTTAYENGISIGCKIGPILENSIAKLIGLEKSDIILSINKKPVANLEDRLIVFDLVTSLKNGDSINLKINRKGKDLELKYILKSIDNPIPEKLNNQKINDNLDSRMIKEDLERRYKFAPTVAEIKEREREAIIKQLHKKNK